MDLDGFLGPNPIVIELRAEDRWQAIDELVDALIANGRIKPGDRESIVSSVRKRESSMSTGIGFGIGLPHASTDLIVEAVGAVRLSKKGIQFDAMDGKPVHRVILFLIPRGQFHKHLNVLANIAKSLHKRDFGQQDNL